MSFGFSAGDFLAAVQLAHKIRKDFGGAPSQFKSLSDETKLLSMVLQDVDVKVDESDLTPQQETNLEQAMSTCVAVLHDLQAVCDKFSDLDTSQGHSRKSIRRVWKKLKWEPNEARELRERISSSIAMLNTLLNQLSGETIVAVKNGVDRLNLGQDRQKRLAILDWLSSFDHMAQQNDISSRRQAGTGFWLLESPEFMSWRSTKGETLFCPGIPGAGKTILSSIVVEELTKQFNDDPSVCVAHAYFNYQQQENQTVEQVFSNLLRQLVAVQPDIPVVVESLYQEHLKKGSKIKFEEVRGLFCGLSSLYSRVFVIVDALDECPSRDGRRNLLLSELMKLQSGLSANVLCTSRPIPEIECWFPKAMSIEVRASEHDVRKYLDGQLGRLPSFVTRDPGLQEQVKKQIVQVVDGMFLLAHLHLESLMYKRTPKALRTTLEGLPRGSSAYDAAYETTMNRVYAQFTEQAELAKDVLQWIVCAKAPLKVSGLQHALAVEVGKEVLDLENLSDSDDMVTACGGLVTIDQESDIIRLVHHTAQEYLERTRDTWFPTTEDQISEICLTYLSFRSFSSGHCQNWYQYQRRLRNWPFYEYACKHWGIHARRTSPERILAFFQLQHAFYSSLQPLLQDQTSALYLSCFSSSSMLDARKEGIAEIHIASVFGLVDVVRKLAARETINQQTASGWSPLAFAAEQGHDAVVRLLLLEHGADANIRDRDGLPPLHRAALRGHINSFKLLLEVGKGHPWHKNPFGEMPLDFAFTNEQLHIFEYFVENLDSLQDRELRDSILAKPGTVGSCTEADGRLISWSHLNLDPSNNKSHSRETSPPLLVLATQHGYNEACETLAKIKRVDVSLVDSNNRTALSCAIERGLTTIIDMLLQASGVDLGSAETNFKLPPSALKAGAYRYPLFYAVKRGEEKVLKCILATTRVNPTATFVGMAISNGHPKVARALLRGPIFDINTEYDRGRTLLSFAAEKGYAEVVDALLQRYQANVNSKDHDRRTPLSYAAENGHEQVVRALLQTPNIDVDSKAADMSRERCTAGRSPLSFAAGNGHLEIVQRLLDTGQVDPDSKSAKNSFYRTPLTWAVIGAGRGWQFGLRFEAIIDLLLKTKRVDLNSTSTGCSLPRFGHFHRLIPPYGGSGQTPLLIATTGGYSYHLVKLLLENGADVDATSDDGETPLSNAIERQDKRVVGLLLEYGAKLPGGWDRGERRGRNV